MPGIFSHRTFTAPDGRLFDHGMLKAWYMAPTPPLSATLLALMVSQDYRSLNPHRPSGSRDVPQNGPNNPVSWNPNNKNGSGASILMYCTGPPGR